jgi:hypothetical protein
MSFYHFPELETVYGEEEFRHDVGYVRELKKILGNLQIYYKY